MSTSHSIDFLQACLDHNFWTWSAQSKVTPIPVTKAKGVYFWDANGKRYLDLNSMVMCVNIGHGDERVIEAIAAQARQLPFAGPQMATQPRGELCKKLIEIVPQGLNKFLFTLGGADANENAIKTGAGIHGAFQNSNPLPFLSRGNLWGNFSHWRPAADGMGAEYHAGGGAFP